MSQQVEPSQDLTQRAGCNWNLRHLGLAFAFAVPSQLLLLQCLCITSRAEFQFALIIDGLLILRVIAAIWLREQSRSWVAACAILYSSTVWISWLSAIVLK